MSEYGPVLFQRAHESQSKFDYFLCSVAGALFAYIAQTSQPQKLENLFSILQSVSLLLLALSFYFGIKRIQSADYITRLIHAEENASDGVAKLNDDLKQGGPLYDNVLMGERVPEKVLHEKQAVLRKEILECRSKIERRMPHARWYAALQLYFLFAGFLLILCAKIWQPYQTNAPRYDSATIQKANISGQLSP